MGKKRGILAEVLHQQQVAAKRRESQNAAAMKALAKAQRDAERAAAQAERAEKAAARSSAADQKAAEREAKRLHEEARAAEVSQLNAELTVAYAEIDGLLAATLDVDDFVDLESLREVAVHPPFSRPDLELPSPQLPPLVAPIEPVFARPAGEPKGLSGVFGKKKYAEALAQAEAEFAKLHAAWQSEVAQLPARQAAQDQAYEQAEAQRRQQLDVARAQYDSECRARNEAAAQANGRLDELIAGLGYDVEEAVQEYVSIVLSNSVYPESFSVDHDFQFTSELRELELTVTVPPPSSLPTAREYKYAKARDEITPTALPAREQKDRYANAVCQVALRSLQEVFEADRAAKIHTISLIVQTESISPATGQPVATPLVAVGADRESFLSINLASVQPAATLQHLGALVSKNPFDLAPIDTSKGVRGR